VIAPRNREHVSQALTIRETLLEGRRLLETAPPLASIDTAALDAALLLGEVLGKRRTDLLAHSDDPVSEADGQRFLSLIQRRRGGECTAYILGRKEFRALEFAVNPAVLVPRPDTETLVEAALDFVDVRWRAGGGESGNSGNGISLLDLCTGSGAVAISLKNERRFLDVTASDISPAALEMAALNARRLLGGGEAGGENGVRFIHSDLFKNIRGQFDIIVSNPPYITSSEMLTLPPEVRREPPLALDGGDDGLALIRVIISQAGEHLKPGGVLLLEAAPRQMPAIRDLLAGSGLGSVEVRKDLAGRERVIAGWGGNSAYHNGEKVEMQI